MPFFSIYLNHTNNELASWYTTALLCMQGWVGLGLYTLGSGFLRAWWLGLSLNKEKVRPTGLSPNPEDPVGLGTGPGPAQPYCHKISRKHLTYTLYISSSIPLCVPRLVILKQGNQIVRIFIHLRHFVLNLWYLQHFLPHSTYIVLCTCIKRGTHVHTYNYIPTQ
jgi:hypothetical protein